MHALQLRCGRNQQLVSIHHVFYLELLSLQLRSSRDSEMHKEKASLLLHQGERQFEAQAFTTVAVNT